MEDVADCGCARLNASRRPRVCTYIHRYPYIGSLAELQAACHQTAKRQPRLPAERNPRPSNGGSNVLDDSPGLPASHHGCLYEIETAGLCTRQSHDCNAHADYCIIESIERGQLVQTRAEREP